MPTSKDKSTFGNLPIPLSTFIGREHEIREIQKLLLSNRLVTLTGAGGCGKTRLALKVAQELSGEFENGVWLTELSSLSESALVPQTIASTLNIREQPGRLLMDSLVDFLSQRQSLLVMDNCEHLISACAQFAETMLQKCPGLKVLATSREALGIAGEVIWTVPQLTLPEEQPWKSPASAQNALNIYGQSEAVQLFVNRATSIVRDFTLNIENASWVSEICRRLDGMPLAIELAAARVRSLSVQQIAERLEDRFNLLTSGGRTAPPRQQTLAATLDWSYALLLEAERKIFQRLSTFSGGWTLEAAESICAGEGVEADEVLDLLSHLVDKSLVVVDKSEGGGMHYRLLETIRQYARERLLESGEAALAHNRHLAFFLQLAEEADPKLRGPDEIIWYERLEREHHNLRAVLSWSLESQNADAGLRLASKLSFFWFVRGYLRESIGWLEKVLSQSQGASAASRAEALKCLGMELYWGRADYDRAALLWEESLTLYRELGDRAGIAWVQNYLGVNALSQGEYAKAEQLLGESLALRRDLGDPWSIAHTLQNFVSLAMQQGDRASAKEHAEETLALFQRAGDQRGVGRQLMELGMIAREQGDSARASALLTEAISQFLIVGDKWSSAYALESLAPLAHGQGDSERAARLFGAAEALRDAIGMPLNPSDRSGYERDVEAVRRRLDEEKFANAWMEGRAMAMEQAIDYALAEPKPAEIEVSLKEKFGGLTEREREVAALIAQGKSNREIAKAMTVGTKTVETYVTRILNKLGFDSRVQIATWMIEKGFNEKDSP